MAKYIENISFFISHDVNIPKEELHASSIFQSDDDQEYIYDIKNDTLTKELKNLLKKEETEDIRIDGISLTLSRFGVCNLHISCSSAKSIDADQFSFDNQLGKVYDKLVESFKEQGIIEKDNTLNKIFEKVDSDSKYLYHQHIADSNLQASIAWSVYTYSTNEISDISLDLDSLLLERNVLNYVFSRCYIKLLNTEETSSLVTIQKLLNANRKALAEHELLLHELESSHFQKFNEDATTQRLDDTVKLYDRLENNIEHLSEQMEDERRHKDSVVMERIFLVLALIGIVSVITGLLALLPGRNDAGCDTNITNPILLDTYSYALGIPGNIVIWISLGLFIVGLALIVKSLRKN